MKKKTILALIAGLLVIALGAALLLRQGTKPQETVPEQTETAVPEKTPGSLDTPFGTLHYPQEWEEYLCITSREDPYTLSFAASVDGSAQIPLFTLGLGENAGESVGECLLADGSTRTLYLSVPAFTPAEEQGDVAETIFAMQDMINQLLEQIQILPDTVETEPAAEPEEMTYGIATVDTPYGQLCYSAQWLDRFRIVQTEGKTYTVAFWGTPEDGTEQRLFDVSFKANTEDATMMVLASDGNLYAVTVTLCPIKTQKLTQAQQDQLLQMQEAANSVLDRLSLIWPDTADSQETLAEDVSEGQTLSVQTPYGTFQLEGQWDGSFRVEYADDGQQLLFYGKVSSHKEQLLFRFDFSQNSTDPISGEERGYCLEVTPLEFDGKWTQAQIDRICGMQEYANDLMQLIEAAKS